MSDPTISQAKINTEPTLKDAFDLLKKDILINLSCHHIGRIQKFNAEKQTAEISIAYSKTYIQRNAETGVYNPVTVDYPILLDCPVIFLGGGLGNLTFPIQEGDDCLVLFNDRSIDNWLKNGQPGPVSSTRLHSFADGIALVGIRPFSKLLENFDETRATLNYGTTMVGVGQTLVKIANDQFTLNQLLQELIAEIKSLTVLTSAITVTGVTSGGGVSGIPVNAVAITNVISQLTATASKIGGLLE